MIRAILPLVLAAGLLGGCASLGVNVDILRPSYASTAAAAVRERGAVAQLIAGNQGPRTAFVARVANQAMVIRQNCYKAAQGRISEALADPKLPAADRAIDVAAQAALARYTSDAGLAESRRRLTDFWERKFGAVDRQAQSALAALPDARRFIADESAAISPGVRAVLDQHGASYDEIAQGDLDIQKRCSFIGDRRTPPAAAASLSVADGQLSKIQQDAAGLNAAVAAPQTILGEGQALTGFADAYFVASAPDTAWQPKFNVARGSAWFGSSDIVVKLNSAADYTIKGFTFDARSTADMVSKAGVASLKLVAQAYGMPSGLVGGSAPATAASPTMTAQTDLATAKAREASFRQTLLSAANLIIGDWDRLTGGDAGATAAVQASFDAHKNAWKATAAPAN